MTTRKDISASERFEVLRRCNFCCWYCGVPAHLGMRQLHVEHVIPVSHGGTNDPWNLVAACPDCNLGKTNGIPTQETIQNVRNDWQGYMESRGYPIVRCYCCGIPIQVFEDEDYGEFPDCRNCNEHIIAAYEQGERDGAKRAVEGSGQ